MWWRRRIHWAFAPAIAALLLRWYSAPFATSLFAIALALLALEQAWMARVDLLAVVAIRQQLRELGGRDNSLNLASNELTLARAAIAFDRIVIATVSLELCGFYGACLNLGGGALVVLLSLAGFNGVIPVHLHPHSPRPIRPVPWGQRIGLVVVDLSVMGLVACWMAGVRPSLAAAALLICVITFASFKYGAAVISAIRATKDTG
ncbi:MAG: hypothetical protein AAFY57_03535 [Cyanobacteria bacterium J06642_2]